MQGVYDLRQAFLDSAARHNRLPYMDNNAFAALVATIIVGERRIGRIPPGNGIQQTIEDIVVSTGCVVSGNYVKEAWEDKDLGKRSSICSTWKFPREIPSMFMRLLESAT